MSDFPVHPFQCIPGTHLEFWFCLEFPCGFFLSFPLRTLLTICGLWRIWKLLPVSKINSFKTRAQEATNHLFHQAWLICEVLQLVPFEVPFPFIFYFLFFFSKCPKLRGPRPHVSCKRLGLARTPLESLLFGCGWARAFFGKLSQVLEMWFKNQLRCFPKHPGFSGKWCCFPVWILDWEKKEKGGGGKNTPSSHTTRFNWVCFSSSASRQLNKKVTERSYIPPHLLFMWVNKTFQQCWGWASGNIFLIIVVIIFLKCYF